MVRVCCGVTAVVLWARADPPFPQVQPRARITPGPGASLLGPGALVLKHVKNMDEISVASGVGGRARSTASAATGASIKKPSR